MIEPDIPGLGAPADEEWMQEQEAPGEVPGAAVWVDKLETVALPGQQGRLVAGSFSQLWGGTMPTGRVRFQVLEQVKPPPPPVPELKSFTVSPSIVKPGEGVSLAIELSTFAGTVQNVGVITPFGSATIPVPAGVKIGTGVIVVPTGQPSGTITLLASYREKTLEQRVLVTQPPVPVVPELVRFVGPATAKPGQTITLEATLSAPAPLGGAEVTIQVPWGVVKTLVPVGQTTQRVDGQIPSSAQEGSWTLFAAYGGKTLTHPISIIKDTPIPPTPIPPTPGPMPPVSRTVDKTGATQQQIQAAIDAAQPGTGIYLGPGLYTLTGPSRSGDGQMLDILNKDGITLFGAGAGTVLDFAGKEGVWLRQGGRIGQGNVIRDLAIRNCRRAVVALDPQRLWVSRVEVVGASHGYASERTGAFDNAMYEWPVIIEDVSVRGWSAHGMMLHGGETVRRCQLVDTPGNSGSTYSHGLYIQGAKNVLVEDVEIANASGHAFQIYSDGATHAANGAENITMRRVTCKNGRYGPILAANGRYTNLLIEDLTVTGTVSRETGTFVISATNDWIEGLVMRNVVLDGGGEGLVLQGGQPGGIRGMVIDNLKIANHNVGIVVAPSGWPYTKVDASVIRDYQASGVSLPVRGSSPGLVIG